MATRFKLWGDYNVAPLALGDIAENATWNETWVYVASGTLLQNGLELPYADYFCYNPLPSIGYSVDNLLNFVLVSRPLAAQTIAGTVKAQMLAYQDYDTGSGTAYARLEIYVVSNNGSTVRGTLLTQGTYNATALNMVSQRNKKYADGDALASLAVQDGDRIVAKFGFQFVYDTNNKRGDSFIGAQDGFDFLAENETDTDDNWPWLEFSQDINLSDGSASDSITVSDSVGTTKYAGPVNRTVSDSVTATDSTVRSAAVPRAVSDSVSTSDSVLVSRSLAKTLADTAITATDSAIAARSLGRTLPVDTVSTSDALARIGQHERADYDSVLTIETVDREVVRYLVTTDSVTRTLDKYRTASDSVSTSDTLVRNLTTALVLSDAASVTDTTVRVETNVRYITDEVFIAEQCFAELSESPISMVDSTARTLSALRVASDSVSMSDAVSRPASQLRTTSDSVSTSDTVLRATQLHRLLSDTAAAADLTLLTVMRALVDSVAASDDVATELFRSVYERSADDEVTVVDQAIRTETLPRAPSDTVATAYSTRLEVWYERETYDEISVSDEYADYRLIDDQPVATADYVDAHLEAAPRLVDIDETALTTTDQVGVVEEYLRVLADTAVVTDSAARTADFARAAADTCTAADQAVRTHDSVRALSDSVSTSDALQVVKWLGPSAADSVSTSDTTKINLEYGRIHSDSVELYEKRKYVISALRTLTDTCSVTDSVQRVPERSGTDLLTVTELELTEASYVRRTDDTQTLLFHTTWSS